MSEKWPTKQMPKKKWLKGTATIKITKTAVKVQFEDSDQVYVIEPANAPENLQAGKFYVSLSEEGDKLFSQTPVKGAFYCKFKKFQAGEDQLPAPYTKSYEYEGKKVEYQAMIALFEVMEGTNQGLEIPYFLRYHFGEVEGNTAFTKERSKYTDQLREFLGECGAFDSGLLEYSDNLLPAIETRLQQAGKKLLIVMKNGFVDSISSVE